MLTLFVFECGDVLNLYIEKHQFFGCSIEKEDDEYCVTFFIEPKIFENPIKIYVSDIDALTALTDELTNFKLGYPYHLILRIDQDEKTIELKKH